MKKIKNKIKEDIMDLLNLKQDQCIIIEKEKYKILNQVKFIEKSSYWIEYKMQNIESKEMYYLNVERDSKVILYKILKDKKVSIKMNMQIEGEEYELQEKGIGKVETYYGMTDVGLKEEVSYYEYSNKSNKEKVLSIEKWKDEIEVSIGRILSLTKIKLEHEK